MERQDSWTQWVASEGRLKGREEVPENEAERDEVTADVVRLADAVPLPSPEADLDSLPLPVFNQQELCGQLHMAGHQLDFAAASSLFVVETAFWSIVRK